MIEQNRKDHHVRGLLYAQKRTLPRHPCEMRTRYDTRDRTLLADRVAEAEEKPTMAKTIRTALKVKPSPATRATQPAPLRQYRGRVFCPLWHME